MGGVKRWGFHSRLGALLEGHFVGKEDVESFESIFITVRKKKTTPFCSMAMKRVCHSIQITNSDTRPLLLHHTISNKALKPFHTHN